MQVLKTNHLEGGQQRCPPTKYLNLNIYIAFQINILAERPDRFWKPVRSENFYFSEKL